MVTLSFAATQAGVDENEDALVAGVACDAPYQYVLFQREAENSTEDWGVHFEFNDQINSGYDCIRQCSLSRRRIRVDLSRPIDPQKRILSIEIELRIADEEFSNFVTALRQVFRGQESSLQITEDDG